MNTAAIVPLAPRIPGCPVPLTASQLRLWHDEVNRGAQRSALRYSAASLRFVGPLDVSRLRSAIESVVHRHESLRTRITGPEEEPRQLIDAPTALRLPLIDFSSSPSDRREHFARRAAEEFISEEIDLATGPLFAASVFKLCRQDYVLVLGIDHFISDAISFSILTREILTLYRGPIESENPSLPRLSVQFPDFAVWQAGTQNAWSRRHAPYWKTLLTSTDKILVPVDHDHLSSRNAAREFLHVPFGKVISGGLADIARRNGTLMPLVVLSIQLVIMSEWCQRGTLLVAFLSHGRKGSLALKNMIGFLAHHTYLLVEVAPSESFKDLLRRVTEEFHTALEHDPSRATGNLVTGCPTELHFNWVHADSTPQLTPLVPEMDLAVRPFSITKPFATTFAPHYYPTPSGVVAEIWYGRDLFEKDTLKWFETGLRCIAREVAQNPEGRIGSLQSLCAR